MNTISSGVRWLLVYAVFLALLSGSVGRAQTSGLPKRAAEVEAAAIPPLFERIVLLGASVSDGFVSSEPLGGPKTPTYRFENFIGAAVNGSREHVLTRAHRFMFMNPLETTQKRIAETLEAKPTLVIALDALFWFCYGEGLTAEARLKRFEEGLELLSRINVPMVIGDLPDASQAVGKILGKGQMPDLATLAACNDRLKAWAAEKKSVTIFPLSVVMAKATADEELSVGGVTVPGGKTRSLLQRDSLHPSRHGLAALAIAALNLAASAAGLDPAQAAVVQGTEHVYATGVALGEASATSTKPEPVGTGGGE
jgi:hypothetical protein